MFGGFLSVQANGFAWAGETGHYPLASKGILGSSLPPPGYYLEMFHIFYRADTVRNRHSRRVHNDFKLRSFAYAHKFIHITGKKLLGADYGWAILVPLVYTDVQAGRAGLHDSGFSLGDIFLEPIILGWHGPRYDIAFSLSAFAPVGKYDRKRPSTAGKGFWSFMFTIGATVYFDDAKTWHLSVLTRTETHTRKRHTDIRPGNNFSLEWGLGKRLLPGFDLGISGYCQWQFTRDSGSDVTWDRDTRDRAFSVGPEVHYLFKKPKLHCILRAQKEFGVVDRPSGLVFALVATKLF